MKNTDPSFRSVIAAFEQASKGETVRESLAQCMITLYLSYKDNVRRNNDDDVANDI